MIDIVYIGDSTYAEAIRVSAASAMRHASRPEEVRIHVVTNDPEFPDIGLDVRHWVGCGRKGWHGTELVWARIEFASLFPECDWVISCDGDTLWLADPAELWGHRDDEKLLLASRDATAPDGSPLGEFSWWRKNSLEMSPERCYCCGLMLMNLSAMRLARFQEQCICFLAEHPDPPMREQTAMCYVARDASAPLPPEWGVFSFWHTTVTDPKLVHYVMDLPWRRDKANRLVSDIVLLWWRERERIAASSPWAGYRGCRNRLDYFWRRMLFLAMKPSAGLIDACKWLQPHFRNARGLTASQWRRFAP